MSRRVFARALAVGAAVAVVLSGPSTAGADPGDGAACAPATDSEPPVPVAVVLDERAESKLTRSAVDSAVAKIGQMVEVRLRLAVVAEAGDEPPRTEDPTPSGGSGWTESDAAAASDAVTGVAEGDLVVVVVADDDELADDLAGPTGRKALVADPVDGDTLASTDDLMATITDAQSELVERGFPTDPSLDALSATYEPATQTWLLDIPRRLGAQVVEVEEIRLPADLNASTTVPPQGAATGPAINCAGAVGVAGQAPRLPVRLEGELAFLTLTVTLADPSGATQAVNLLLETEPAEPPGAATTAPPAGEGGDGEAAVAQIPGGDGADDGSSPLPLIAAAIVGLGLVAGVVLVVTRRRPAAPGAPAPAFAAAVPGAPGPGGGAPPGPPPVAAPPPPPPPPVEAPPVEPPPPVTVADASWQTAVAVSDRVALDGGGTPVAPQGSAGRLGWIIDTGAGLQIGTWSEKIVGQGEDAEPLVHAHPSGAAIVGVFDGTGGSGAATARRDADGTERSGAFIGARLAKEVTRDWFTARALSPDATLDADSLTRHLASWFRQVGDARETSGPAVRGSLHRVLPTTLAAVAVRPHPRGAIADVVWAGDSRCFVLRPDRGLQVLTLDDTRETDALALIRDDYPMHNLVSADREFRINHRQLRLALPAVLIAATDGCYGYVQTPAHFEFHLLDTLAASASPEEWMLRLTDRLGEFNGDDASLAMTCPGLSDFSHLRAATAPRLAALRAEHWEPFQTADPETLDEWRDRSWAAYRPTYEARLREGDTA